MGGKEKLDFMLLGLQREGSLVLHMMLSKLLKILLKFGNKRLNKRNKLPMLAINVAFLNSKFALIVNNKQTLGVLFLLAIGICWCIKN
jgi:uncharacterized membrane protein YwaF